MRILADPNADAVECAKVFKNLANEVKTAASPGSLAEEIGTEVLDAKLHAALAAAEQKYPHEFEAAEAIAKEVKAAHDGHKLGEKIDKDARGIEHDFKEDLRTAVGKHDYAGMASASKHLYDHSESLHHDVKAAEELVSAELALAKAHPAGMQGHLHPGGHAGAGHAAIDPSTFSSTIVNDVPTTPSPLDNVTPNAPATVAPTQHGYEAHTNAPGQQPHQQQHQQHAAHAGR